MLYIYAHSGIGIPEASNISFWNPQIFRVIDMYEQHSKNLAPYLYSNYKSTVAHEFGHTLGLGDAYKTNDDGKVLSTNSEVSNAQGASNIMYYNDKVYTNDIEMVLEAYVTGEHQYYLDRHNVNFWFYKNFTGENKSTVIRERQVFV